jgi:microcystin-dependent protein
MAEPYVGEIRMFGGNYAPIGWALCNGQLLSISENEALYSLLGTTYGGDGVTTFALPDMRGRIPVHKGQNPVTGTSYSLGEKSGVETVTLIESQMPMHTHGVRVSSQPGTEKSPSNNVWAQKIVEYSTSDPTVTMNPSSLSSTGGSMPHENMMPFGVICFIIAREGIFPPQG